MDTLHPFAGKKIRTEKLILILLQHKDLLSTLVSLLQLFKGGNWIDPKRSTMRERPKGKTRDVTFLRCTLKLQQSKFLLAKNRMMMMMIVMMKRIIEAYNIVHNDNVFEVHFLLSNSSQN